MPWVKARQECATSTVGMTATVADHSWVILFLLTGLFVLVSLHKCLNADGPIGIFVKMGGVSPQELTAAACRADGVCFCVY